MISHSVEETKQIVINFLEEIIFKGLRKQATVIGLYGDLGYGKTTFVQLAASVLDIKGSIQSPTFVIMKKYELIHSTFKNFIHIDLYRLNSGKEIEKLGWKEIILNPENLVFIEWPERIGDAMPKNHIRISFSLVDKTARDINITL